MGLCSDCISQEIIDGISASDLPQGIRGVCAICGKHKLCYDISCNTCAYLDDADTFCTCTKSGPCNWSPRISQQQTESEVARECDTCAYVCKQVDCRGYSKWFQKAIEDDDRKCENCLYNGSSAFDDPCCNCDDQSEWALEDLVKECKTCEHYCPHIDSCENGSKWAPIVDDQEQKNDGVDDYGICSACKYAELSSYTEPCKTCDVMIAGGRSNWEPYKKPSLEDDPCWPAIERFVKNKEPGVHAMYVDDSEMVCICGAIISLNNVLGKANLATDHDPFVWCKDCHRQYNIKIHIRVDENPYFLDQQQSEQAQLPEGLEDSDLVTVHTSDVDRYDGCKFVYHDREYIFIRYTEDQQHVVGVPYEKYKFAKLNSLKRDSRRTTARLS